MDKRIEKAVLRPATKEECILTCDSAFKGKIRAYTCVFRVGAINPNSLRLNAERPQVTPGGLTRYVNGDCSMFMPQSPINTGEKCRNKIMLSCGSS